jgi:hypothetical protein
MCANSLWFSTCIAKLQFFLKNWILRIVQISI